MDLLNQIKQAGVVGCGGAGFPAHVKLNCKVEYFIVNAAECEPLLRTDRWLMKHRAAELLAGVELAAAQVGAKYSYIALKETYREEIVCLKEAIAKDKRNIELFLLKNYYPAGDEQVIVCEVTGRSVPPAGIPLDVGAVVSNTATVIGIYEAAQGNAFTHKYLTVTGAVAEPVIVKAPIGTSFWECLQCAGGPQTEHYAVLAGGPLMGKLYRGEQIKQQVVTKTTSGLVVVPADIPLVSKRETSIQTSLRRAKTACIQCSSCTEMCPRYLLGHPLKPHKIMRKLAYAGDLEEILGDSDVRQAAVCSECGVCENFACPMGLDPRKVNGYIKAALAGQGFRYEKPKEPVQSRAERNYRRVPGKRIAARLGVEQYYDYQIDTLKEITAGTVVIPLKQHIGAPSKPLVAAGDTVICGQLIGTCPEQALGAEIHASIDGVVTEVGAGVAIERRP